MMTEKATAIELRKTYKVVSDSKYLHDKYGEDIEAWVEDTDVNVFGKSWMWMDGNPGATLFALRTGMEGRVDLGATVYYTKIKGLGELLLESELGELVPDVD
jgi:hypothetical protein